MDGSKKQHSELEVYRDRTPPEVVPCTPQPDDYLPDPPPSDEDRTCCGLKTPQILLGVTVILIIGLISGLAAGLAVRKHHHTPVLPQLFGAMNGSGIVALDLDNKSTITAYTQRFDGVIGVSQYIDGNWTGGTLTQLVTATGNFNDETLAAKNGTPLMALSYVNDGELIWHLFYVTVDNFLSDWVNSNLTNSWSQGTLRSGNYAVFNSPHVGLSACVNTQWYGAPYNSSGLGIRLYYGSSDNAIQELGWNLDGQTTWFNGSLFNNSNAAGGVECTVGGASITYIWMENLQGELQQMWYDFNLSAGTENHTVGTWMTGLTYSNILHNSAISAISDFSNTPHIKLVHFQTPDLDIVEIIANGTAEADSWEGEPFVVGTEKGINGTRIGSDVLYTGIGSGQEIHVIFQTNATDMMDWIRDLTDSNWAPKVVPVGL